jgi:hypothetical protein
MKNVITNDLIEKAYTYPQYKELVAGLIEQKRTTGNTQSEKYIAFTRLNSERVKRIEKTTLIEDDVKNVFENVKKELIFLVIAEAWCGDVAQNLPVIDLLARLNPKIDLRIILRDENDEVMKHFLTNGGKAIPVCLVINKSDLSVLGKWGPRPDPPQSIMREHKSNPVESYDETGKKIQLWYLQDKGKTLGAELSAMLKSLMLD